ncbi:MAG: HAD-IC family P-type ATPase [Eubacteriales bacterium]
MKAKTEMTTRDEREALAADAVAPPPACLAGEEPLQGLSTAQVAACVAAGQVNRSTTRVGKTIPRIFFDNICTFFNLVWLLVTIALISVHSFSDLLFLVIIGLNTGIAIFQEIKAKRTVEKLSLTTNPKVRVLRDGEMTEVAAEELVPGDLIRLEVGGQVPSDCVVAAGKAEVNESLLTGESNAIRKAEGERLLAGSFLVSGSCCARVEHVGDDNYIKSLESQAKKFKSPSSNLFRDLNRLISAIGIFLVPMSLAMYINNYFYYQKNVRMAIIKTCGSVTGMIPAGMFLLVTLALSVGVVKLSRKRTLVQDMYSIEMLARTDVLCLDKTGTITDGTMHVSEFVLLGEQDEETARQAVAEVQGAQSTANATSAALAAYFGSVASWTVTANIAFSSARKYTATAFEGRGTYALGAPEFLNAPLTEERQALLAQKAAEGKRVLLLTHSDTLLAEEDEALPPDGRAVAMVCIEDRIREDAAETIAYFVNNGVEIKIISGDNPLTVSHIARRVGVAGAERYLSLEGMPLEEVEKVARLYTVFGRVSPEQKVALVKALKKAGHVVAMTGDGVNDTLALKESDCSIAMADGSEVARKLAKLVLLDSRFSSLPEVVREGRRVINNVQQSSTLFLMKTVFTILLSFFAVLTLSGYPFSPKQLVPLELLVIGIPSLLFALQPNHRLIKGDFLPVVLKCSAPAGLLLFASVFVILLNPLSAGLSTEEVDTLCTLVLTFVGFVNLFFISLPPTRWRVLCVVFSLVSVTVAVFLLGDFFGVGRLTEQVQNDFLLILLGALALHIILPLAFTCGRRLVRQYRNRK